MRSQNPSIVVFWQTCQCHQIQWQIACRHAPMTHYHQSKPRWPTLGVLGQQARMWPACKAIKIVRDQGFSETSTPQHVVDCLVDVHFRHEPRIAIEWGNQALQQAEKKTNVMICRVNPHHNMSGTTQQQEQEQEREQEQEQQQQQQRQRQRQQQQQQQNNILYIIIIIYNNI